MTPAGRCDRCDGPGGAKTYANQACLPLGGRVMCIDWCIHQIVAALNAGGVKTLASCCGHGTEDGLIHLEDGRVLVIRRTEDVPVTRDGAVLLPPGGVR